MCAINFWFIFWNHFYVEDEKRDKFADEAPWYLGKRNGATTSNWWANRHDWTIGKRSDGGADDNSGMPEQILNPQGFIVTQPRSTRYSKITPLRYGRSIKLQKKWWPKNDGHTE